MSGDRAWTVGVAAFLLILWAIGGSSRPGFSIAFMIQIFSLVMLVIGVLRLRKGIPSRTAGFGLGLTILGVGLVGLQLLPLPPGLWTILPGRQFVVESLAASGSPLGWMPLSLTPPETRAVLLALLPALAMFIAALSLRPEDRIFLAIGLLIAVVASVLLGLAQKFQGPASPLYWHENSSVGSATGPFANRNFLAALLYSSIPFIAALAVVWTRRRDMNRLLIALFAFTVLAVVIIGLGATGSRAGIVLAIVAVLASGLLAWGKPNVERGPPVSRFKVLAQFGAFFLIAQFGLVGILRLAQTDPVTDYRGDIYSVSLKALTAFFPMGSGFGSFVPVYAMHETPITILSSYVNHAHNDWLELIIEGGLPMVLILAAFLIWFVMSAARVWRQGSDRLEDMIVKAAAIAGGLLLLHSFVDYPLRTPFLMGLFALYCGLMACESVPRVSRYRPRTPSAFPPDAPEVSSSGVAAPRKGPYFVRKEGTTST